MQTTTNTSAPQSSHIANTAVATEAYYQWLKAGQPAGRDQEFWLKAEAALKNGEAAPRNSTTGGPKSGAKAASKR